MGIEKALLELQRKLEAVAFFTDFDASWRKMLVAQPPIRRLGVMDFRMSHNRQRNRSPMANMTPRR